MTRRHHASCLLFQTHLLICVALAPVQICLMSRSCFCNCCCVKSLLALVALVLFKQECDMVVGNRGYNYKQIAFTSTVSKATYN